MLFQEPRRCGRCSQGWVGAMTHISPLHPTDASKSGAGRVQFRQFSKSFAKVALGETTVLSWLSKLGHLKQKSPKGQIAFDFAA